jgi:BirA family biotin operon repressor/biotin-[acetyl-CoA-carboxylase] ligase
MLKIFVSEKVEVKFICDVIKSLNKDTIFKEFYYFNKLASTQGCAHKIIKTKRKIYPSIIICKTQSRGRGRKGNYWHSAEGGIWMSIILETDYRIEFLFIFIMVCAICIIDTIESETPLKAQLKWPNDIFINGKKIAGLLIDVEPTDDRYCVINGIGINTNNDLDSTVIEIKDGHPSYYGITTLKKELNNLEISNEIFLSKLLNNLSVFFMGIVSHSIDFQSIFRSYKKRIMESKDNLVYVFKKDDNRDFDGEIIDLFSDGSLLVRDIKQNKTIQLYSSYNVNLK